ncbi:sigma-70 family RNA polymerase sigma factor [Clostridiales bacterium]|nr:sigma-70 family RNA polymerase sigma factor [Clostridiales bacterium]
MIADCNIPGADPTSVIEQYEPFLKTIAKKYTYVLNKSGAVGFDDLIQVGRIAIIDAQKRYEPDKGAFITFLAYRVRAAMQRTLGFNCKGEAPKQLVYLDAPISDESEDTLGDTVADLAAPTVDENITESETKREISEQVREALNRMKSEKQREVITRIYIDGQERTAAAADMGMKYSPLCALERAGKRSLHRDEQLKQFVIGEIPFFTVGVMQFNCTWTSATEKTVIWRDKHIFHNDDDMDEELT